MMTEPTAQHRWLHQMIGKWTFEHECSMGPDQPPMKSSGREVVRAMGDLWIIAELEGTMPDGAQMTAMMTLGYDTNKQRFVGSWVGSPMAFMFVYEGSLDDQRTTLTLDTTGPSMTNPGGQCPYQDIFEIRSASERWLRSRMQLDDGSWVPFMKGVYTRSG